MRKRIFSSLHAIRNVAISIVMSMLMLAAFPGSVLAQATAPSVVEQTKNTASPVATRKSFDHLKTGFALRGAHLNVSCETCHVGGTFKGTPKVCAECHSVGRAIAALPKNQEHIQTDKACDACHYNAASFLTAVMDHTNLTQPCAFCHNGSTQEITSKSSSHISTTLPCDNCHKNTYTFLGSKFDHTNTTSDCANCHDNHVAPGMPANHLPTNGENRCEACHTTTVTPGWPTPSSFLGAIFDHNGTGNTIGSANCSSCHGQYAGVVKKSTGTSGHITTSLQCDACHTSTTTFTAWQMNHQANGNTSGCASCHTGAKKDSAVVIGKPTNHIPVPASTLCESCHTNTSPGGFATWSMSHAGITNNCASCHKASGDTVIGTATVKGQSANHIKNSSVCELCHSNAHTNVGEFATSWKMVHAAVTPTLTCASCHDTSASTPASVVKKMASAALGANGASLHIPYNAGIDCATCHVTNDSSTDGSGFATWTMGSSGHNSVSTTCASCHSPTGATFFNVSANWQSYPANHSDFSPVATSTSSCSGCHTAANTGSYTTFKGATAGHDTSAAGITAATGNCTSCHNAGGPGKVFTSTHIPSSAPGGSIAKGGVGQCDNCHTTSYLSFTFAGATMNHVPGTAYAANARCDSCHITAYASEGVKNTTATTHISIPSGTDCNVCHKNTSSFTGWLASDVHTAVGAGTTTTCASCHDNSKSYTGVVTKPASSAAHIAYNASVDCKTCHSSLTTFTTWAMGLAGHTNVATAVPLCSTCHGTTASAPASVVKQPVAAAVGSNGSTLHIPYNSGVECGACHGTGYTSFTSWTMVGSNHNNVTITCSSCHSPTGATFLNVSLVTYPSNHSTLAPTATGPSDNCAKSGCHNTTSFKGAGHDLSAAGIAAAAGNCASCHYSGGTGKVFTSTHIPSSAPGASIAKGGVGQCDTCHTTAYTTLSFASATMSHAATAYPSATKCNVCHTSTYVSEGVKTTAATTHITIPSGKDCNACHKNTSSFTGWLASDVHTTVGAGTSPYTCASCHDNTHSYTGVVVKPVSATAHIAYNTGIDCNTCHSSLSVFTTWTMGTGGHTNVATAVPLCSTCHGTGASAPASVVKQPTAAAVGSNGSTLHIPYTSGVQCGTCHGTGYTSFATWTMVGANHSNVSTTCSACHSPSGAAFYNVTLVSFPATGHTYAASNSNCASCHTTTTFLGATGGHDLSAAGVTTATGNCASSGCHITGGQGKVFTSSHIPSSTPGAAIAKNGIGQCDNCHTTAYTSQTFASATMSHAATAYPSATKCNVCHTSTYVSEGVKTTAATTHITIPSGKDCNACHKNTSSFTGWLASDVHTTVGAGTSPYTCASCHDNTHSYTGVVVKPVSATAHIAYNTGIDCNTCHSSLSVFTTWTMGTGGHTNVATAVPLCSTCHDNGKTFPSVVVKPASPSHIPYNTGVQCNACHGTGYSTFTTWAMGTSGHTNVATAVPLCASCHDTSAPAYPSVVKKIASHIKGYPAEDCGICHTSSNTGSYTSFLGMNMVGLPGHTSILSGCATCHNGTTAMGTSSFPGHIAIGTQDCSGCHTPSNTSTYTTFLGATAGHTYPQTTQHNCATAGCHVSGGAGRIFTSQHIPSSAAGATIAVSGVGQCDYCHTTSYGTSAIGSFTSYTAANIHTATGYPSTTRCDTCHNGTYTGEGSIGAQAKTLVNHIPTTITGTLDCNTCHKSAIVISATAWTSETMNHNGAQGGGTTPAGVYCVNCHLTGVTYLGKMEKKSHNGASTAKDCSISGCHKPRGSKGTAYVNWD